MAHPPPPPGPPPGIGEGEEAFRLAVYHISRRSVRREDGSYVYVRQYIYKSEWYRSELEPCILQWNGRSKRFCGNLVCWDSYYLSLIGRPRNFQRSKGRLALAFLDAQSTAYVRA